MLSPQRRRPILILIFFIVHLNSVFGTPPSIEAETNSIIVDTGSTLTIFCTGIYDVLWKPLSNSSATSRKMYQHSNFNTTTKKYKNKLRITNILYSDTGHFSCSYEKAPRNSLEFTSSIYVFVRDANNLLAPWDTYNIIISSTKRNVIPCRPTNPEVKIQLKKIKQLVNTNYKDILFDNRVGFIILYPNLFYNGVFTCEAELNGKINQSDFSLFQDTNQQNLLASPRIDLNGNTVITTGKKIVFSCLINVPTENEYVLKWKYPNKQTYRIIQGPQKSYKQTSKNSFFGSISFFEIVRNITIEGVEKKDEGVYECVATKNRQNRSNVQIYITICESKCKPLKLKANFSDIIYTYRAGGKETFTVQVQTKLFELIELKWLKNNKIFDCVGISSNCKIMRSADRTTSINFLNFNRNDSANYSLMAKDINIKKFVNFTLWIEEKPSVIINPTYANYIADNEYNITCSIYAKPKAYVYWTWSPCAIENCHRDHYLLSINAPNKERIITTSGSWYIKSILTITVKETGYYTCVAMNELGKSKVEHLLIVTDAANNSQPIGLGFINFNHSSLQNDPAKIECRASKFNFTSKSLTLKFQPSDDYYHHHLYILRNRPGLTLTATESDYTYGITATFDSIQQVDVGCYVCEALTVQGKMRTSPCKHLNVLPIRALKVERTNMDGSVYAIERKKQFRFICNVSSLPLPRITWMKNTEIINKTSHRQFLFPDNFTLEIPRVAEEDGGLYSCNVTSRGSSLYLNGSLIVIADVTSSLSLTNVLIITFIVIVMIIVIILSILLIRKCHARKKQIMYKICEFDTEKYEKGAIEQYNPELPLEDQIDILPYDKRWEFPRDKLKLKKNLGSGAFGKVMSANAQGISPHEKCTTVAVKMLKDHASAEQQKAFMQELKIMTHLGCHMNVLNLLGACMLNAENGQLYIVMEYCRYGCLRKYLQQNRDHFVNQINPETDEIDFKSTNSTNIRIRPISSPPECKASGEDDYLIPRAQTMPQSSKSVNTKAHTSIVIRSRINKARIVKNPLTTCDLFSFAFQTAQGMEYLESRKLIHRDLALRNILLAKNKVVKICDFGLTKDCYDKSYYRKKGDGSLPIKWLAAECIRDRVFTSKSDVWSFGIALWELFTLGGDPYPGSVIDEYFLKRILNGYRMEKPEFGTDELYRIMRECWHNDPKQRPSFNNLSDWVGSQLPSTLRDHFIQLNTDYLKSHGATATNHEYLDISNQILNHSNAFRLSSMSEFEDCYSPSGYITMRGSQKSDLKSDRIELKPMLPPLEPRG